MCSMNRGKEKIKQTGLDFPQSQKRFIDLDVATAYRYAVPVVSDGNSNQWRSKK